MCCYRCYVYGLFGDFVDEGRDQKGSQGIEKVKEGNQ